MATISSLGIGSGLDFTSIVSGLVDAERAPVEARLESRKEGATTKLSAFGALRSSLSLLQGSLSNLKFSSTFDAKQVDLSDDSVFSTSVSSNADIGSYSVEVNELARAHSLASAAATAFDDINDSVGTGTLTFNFGATTTGPYSFTRDNAKATQSIVVSAENNNTTLTTLRDYINDNDYDFNASIVNDGSGYRMVFTSADTGADNSMEIAVTNDADADNTDNAGLSMFAFNAAAQASLSQTVAAQDALISVNGLAISRDTNTVTGAIDGVTLNLLKADIGNTITLNVTESSSGAKSAIKEFVDGYNGLIQTANTLSSYNSDAESAGILQGDFTLRNILNQLKSEISSLNSGLSNNIRSLADIGIKTKLDGTLELDESALVDALTNYSSEVAALFTEQGQSSDATVGYLSATANTQPGQYAVNVETMASRAVLNGATVNSLVIDDGNDQFTINIDGQSSDSISLTHAVYADGDGLAAHIQAQINSDGNLKSAGVSVNVSYDGTNNEFDIYSSRYGSASSIKITAVDTNSANDLGLSIAAGISGNDVSGTINGLSASGNGQILSSIAGNSVGLAIAVTGGSAGNRGTFSFSRGFIASLNDRLDGFLQTGGYIGSREEGLNSELEELIDEYGELDARLESLESRLVKQFSALDGLIAKFNSTSEFLTQQLANLPKPNSVGNN